MIACTQVNRRETERLSLDLLYQKEPLCMEPQERKSEDTKVDSVDKESNNSSDDKVVPHSVHELLKVE